MARKIYQATSLPSTGTAPTPSNAGVYWLNPSRITARDGSSATVNLTSGGDFGAVIRGTGFSWGTLPPDAVIAGIQVRIVGAINQGGNADVQLSIPGTVTKNTVTLNESWGGVGYFWGLAGLTVADLVGLQVNATFNDFTGGADATMDYMEVTLFWYIELDQPYSPGLPTTFSYRVYSKDGVYLGDLPNVVSPFAFVQDINSAGATLKTICGVSPMPVTTSEAILDNNSVPIQTQTGFDILATDTYKPFVPGDSEDTALFKNGNRLKVWIFNQWWPNGKLMFSGQMNRLDFGVGSEEQISVTSYSDGMDLENYYARGYPFSYSTDQQQTTQNATFIMSAEAFPGAGWERIGQVFTTGAAAPNLGQVQVLLNGSATVTMRVYDAPNGNFIGSVTQVVSGATFSSPTSFNLASLIPTSNLTSYFFNLDVSPGQSIDVGINYPTGGYSGGQAYFSSYGGGGGGSFAPGNPPFDGVDMWFKTGIGTPTTTTTYAASDPVTGMAHGILADYNSRGGRIVERDFTAAGYTLTYTFNSATINAAIQKILELSPAGYYAYVDLGDSEIDILPTSEEADFIVVVGRDISKLDFSLTIERVKNQLLFSGGDTGGGTNLFRLYQDTESSENYEPRLAQKSDNRITLSATMDAAGQSFIDENAGEIQETQVTLLNERVDITQFTPGKTIGFQNAGDFIDSLVLQIVHREFNHNSVTLTIGRLPVTQTAEVQRLNREMLNEQTVANPSQPS